MKSCVTFLLFMIILCCNNFEFRVKKSINSYNEISYKICLFSTFNLLLGILSLRQDLGLEQLKCLILKFPNSAEYGKIVVAQVELMLEMKEMQKAKDLIEETITGK